MRMPITTYAWMRPLLLLAASTASNTYVDVTGDLVQVRMGFGFGTSFPRDLVVLGHQVGDRRLMGGCAPRAWCRRVLL